MSRFEDAEERQHTETTPLLDDDADRTAYARLSRIYFATDVRQISLAAEAKVFLRYCAPLTLTYLLQYANSLIVIFVASRFSTEELAGVSLAITTQNILGWAIFEGMATALDTLCSQA